MVEFQAQKIPDRLYPIGYRSIMGRTTVRQPHFVEEILAGMKPDGGFADRARSEEVATAVYEPHLARRWVDLP